ncbi:HAD family hydrolase [Lysobacter cavernae]|uniref:HAD family hydrolase n=1 Tax=Lysobacter cavernae TaxID=1685901 RepID=A0ABV7RTA9_9GAMM
MTIGDMRHRALLVDFDGVLRHWPDNDHAIEREHGLEAGAIRRVAFDPDLLARVVSGGLSDTAWRKAIVDRLSGDYSDANVQVAVEQWSRPVGVLDEDVLALLIRARRRVRVVLVTNASTRLDADLRALRLDNTFYAVVNSSQVGVAKPDPAFFEVALSQAGVAAERALYVDDAITNVAVARELGITSKVHDDAESLHAFLLEHGALVIEP